MQRLVRIGLMLAGFGAMAQAGPFSSVVVYGDSLSDNGNLFAVSGYPPPPYYAGRLSNGPVAVEQLAVKLGAPLLDFAWAGASTGIGNLGDGGTPTGFGLFGLPGMKTELANTQAMLGPFLSTGLFVVWGGPNDFLAPSPLDTTPQAVITRAVGDVLSIVTTLQGLGAHNILVPGMADLGLSPDFLAMGPVAAAQATAATSAFNQALRSSLPPGVLFYDTAALLRDMVANPSKYGLTDVKDACFNGTTVCADASKYLFFDSLHPTTAVDAFAAQALLAAVTPEPSGFLLAFGGVSWLGITRLRRRRGRRVPSQTEE